MNPTAEQKVNTPAEQKSTTAAEQKVTAALLRSPAALYRRLHARGPVQWSEPGRTWLVVGYAAAREVLRDQRFRMPGPGGGDATWGEGGRYGEFVRSLLLEAEGSHHERLRRILSPVFAPRSVRARTERITATVHELLDELAGAAEFDGVAALGARLPVSVVGDLVGVPPADRDQVSRLCRLISTGGGLSTGAAGPQAVAGAVGGLEQLFALVDQWLAAPDRLPAGSVLAATAEQALLSRVETVATVFSLYLAGHDTSRNMLGALLLRLSGQDGLLEQLAERPQTAGEVVDQVLLGESPLTFTARVALADVRVAGRLIAQGDRVQIMLGAANHELLESGAAPGQFAGVAFGEGRHVCLGAHLARLEGTVLLTAAAERWAGLEPAGDPQWSPHFLHRGLGALPLKATWRS
ncbi:hypothetical protein C7C46_13105 [Streptomyces tateyamensis]|uniref:Cytochrome P450 n=1 Tax=Streptomyces tateyamensis TaxID=565073 RepID=A0A2V4N7V9_9ACTN|nr:cytochrome P450 [Streptomyces tateyamensis]AXG25751.1 cytochrome P450 [Streptomyces tateyamensis]PYC80222.1 hypothetical protein C7C46_13105 [Streptomyces tateyamensis]